MIFIKNDKMSNILLALTLLWMGVIFYFSAQPAVNSTMMSSRATAELLKLFDSLFKGQTPFFITGVILNGDHYVRKSGHVIEFAILGMLVFCLLRRILLKKVILTALVICVIYAASDEFHQLFVPGRAAMPGDVVLDTAAALIGIIIVYLFSRRGVRYG